MIDPDLLALVAGGIWLIAFCLARLSLGARWQSRAARGLTLAGVPVLGWLTLAWGPGPGVAALAMGVALLLMLRRPSQGQGTRLGRDTGR